MADTNELYAVMAETEYPNCLRLANKVMPQAAYTFRNALIELIKQREELKARLAASAVPDDVAKDARLGNRLYVWDYENPEDGSWDNIEEYLHDTTPNVGEVVRLNLALPLVDVVVEMLEVGKCGEPIRWEVRDVKTGAILSATEGRSNG